MALASDGSIWFGCGPGVCRIQGSAATQHWGVKEGLPKSPWKYLLFDPKGDLWVRGASHIARLKAGAGNFELLDPPGAPNQHFEYRPLAADSQGRISAPLDCALGRYDDGKWQLLSENNSLAGEVLTSVLTDREGSVWMGVLGQGLQRWIGYGEWEHWTKQDGMQSNLV